LFLTCGHNFGEKVCGLVIRLHNGDTVRDYPIEHIIYRYESHDLLLISVKDLLYQHQCLKFCTNEVKGIDKVVLLGFSSAPLWIKNKELVPTPVQAYSILTSVSIDAYEITDHLGVRFYFCLMFFFSKNHYCFFLIHSTSPYKTDDGNQLHEKMHYNCQAIQGHSGSPLFKKVNLLQFI